MKLTIVALSLLVAVLLFGRGAGAAAAEGGAQTAWMIVNPEGDYDAQLQNQKVVLDLLRNGVTVYWFTTGEKAPAKLKRGDYVVLVSDFHARYAKTLMEQIPAERWLQLPDIADWKGYKLAFPRVMLDGHKYALTHHFAPYHDCLRWSGFRFAVFGGKDASRLEERDVLVVPGGSGGPDKELGQIMRDFQKRGGGYVGSCNACLIAHQPREKRHKESRMNLGVGMVDALSPIVLDGGYEMVNTEVFADHPVMWHIPPEFTIKHQNGPVLDPTGPSCTPLAVVKGISWESEKMAVAKGKPVWLAAQRPGEGRVVLFGNHPEVPSLRGTKFLCANRAVYDAIFWCTAGDEVAIELGIEEPEQPAGWFDLGGDKPGDAAKELAAAQQKVARAIKLNNDAPKFYYKGTHKKLAHAELSSIQNALAKMNMAGGGDKAGWFARRRSELLAELMTSLEKWPTPFKWGYGEVLENMPTEHALKLEEWVRDYENFLKAHGK